MRLTYISKDSDGKKQDPITVEVSSPEELQEKLKEIKDEIAANGGTLISAVTVG